MKPYFKISTIAILFLLTSFTEMGSKEITLQKCWVLQSYKNGIIKLISKPVLSPNKRGMEFKAGGIVKLSIEKSFCGLDHNLVMIEGTWEKISDSIFVIKYKQWGQDFAMKKKIIKLTKNKLLLKNLEDDK